MPGAIDEVDCESIRKIVPGRADDEADDKAKWQIVAN